MMKSVSLLAFRANPVKTTASVKDVMLWYNGYYTLSGSIINPWSFMSWFTNVDFKTYWVNSWYILTLRKVLSPHIMKLLLEFYKLINVENYSQAVSAGLLDV